MIAPPFPIRVRRTICNSALLTIAALVTWACDPAQGVGTVSTEKPVGAIDVEARKVDLRMNVSSLSIGFDAVNSSLIDKNTDHQGRLFGVNVHWTSSNPAVMQVVTPDVVSAALTCVPFCADDPRPFGSKVVVKPVSVGTATLTGTVTGAPTVQDVPVTQTIEVTVRPVPAKVVATPDPVSAPLGTSVSISADVFSDDGTVLPSYINWRCGDTTIAVTVDPDVATQKCEHISSTFGVGHKVLVTGRKVGTTVLYADYILGRTAGVPEYLTDTITVVVPSNVARVVVTPATASLVVGGSRLLTAQAFDAAGNVVIGLPVTWGSRNTTVLSVDAAGTARGIASGTAPGLTQSANAFATIGGVSGDATLKVYRTPGNVIVTPATNALDIGHSVTLHAKLVDSDNTTQIPFAATSMTWLSDNPAVATVTAVDDSTATLTGVAVGHTSARARAASGVSGIADVTIDAPTVPTVPPGGAVVSMKLAPAGATVQVGKTQQFTATLYDANNNVVPVPAGWSIGYAVDDSNVGATVNTSGLVKGVGVGNTFVRSFFLGAGSPQNIFASSTLTVIP